MNRPINHMIINGVIIPLGGAMPIEELELPLRILGCIAFVVLLGSAAFILWNLTAVAA